MATKIFLVILITFFLGVITTSEAFTLERLGRHFDQKLKNPEFFRAKMGLIRTIFNGVMDMFHNYGASSYGK